MDFEALLEKCKAEFRPEDAIVTVLEPALLMYAAAWPRVTVKRIGEPAADTWDGLWGCVKVDIDSLAMLLDVPNNKAIGIVLRLKALRVVYPDGTVPDLVRKVIQKRVTDALKG